MVQIASAPPARENRVDYLDFLRVLACFLVIVNHTNNPIFLAIAPTGFTWYASITYHFICKMDISLFLLISGACMLRRVEGYRSILRRELRILALLLLFSCVEYFRNAPYANGLSFVLSGFPAFLRSLWTTPAVGAYWYLYLYLGMLLMLPFFAAYGAGHDPKPRLLSLFCDMAGFWQRAFLGIALFPRH